jgi:hypothetical protein
MTKDDEFDPRIGIDVLTTARDRYEAASAACAAAIAVYESAQTKCKALLRTPDTTTGRAIEAAMTELKAATAAFKLSIDELETASEEIGDLIGEGYLK